MALFSFRSNLKSGLRLPTAATASCIVAFIVSVFPSRPVSAWYTVSPTRPYCTNMHTEFNDRCVRPYSSTYQLGPIRFLVETKVEKDGEVVSSSSDEHAISPTVRYTYNPNGMIMTFYAVPPLCHDFPGREPTDFGIQFPATESESYTPADAYSVSNFHSDPMSVEAELIGMEVSVSGGVLPGEINVASNLGRGMQVPQNNFIYPADYNAISLAKGLESVTITEKSRWRVSGRLSATERVSQRPDGSIVTTKYSIVGPSEVEDELTVSNQLHANVHAPIAPNIRIAASFVRKVERDVAGREVPGYEAHLAYAFVVPHYADVRLVFSPGDVQISLFRGTAISGDGRPQRVLIRTPHVFAQGPSYSVVWLPGTAPPSLSKAIVLIRGHACGESDLETAIEGEDLTAYHLSEYVVASEAIPGCPQATGDNPLFASHQFTPAYDFLLGISAHLSDCFDSGGAAGPPPMTGREARTILGMPPVGERRPVSFVQPESSGPDLPRQFGSQAAPPSGGGGGSGGWPLPPPREREPVQDESLGSEKSSAGARQNRR